MPFEEDVYTNTTPRKNIKRHFDLSQSKLRSRPRPLRHRLLGRRSYNQLMELEIPVRSEHGFEYSFQKISERQKNVDNVFDLQF